MGSVCGFLKQKSLARGAPLPNYRHHGLLSNGEHGQGSVRVGLAPGRHIACETLGLRRAAQTRPAPEQPEPTSQPREGELRGVPEGLSLGAMKGKDPGKVLDWSSDREGERPGEMGPGARSVTRARRRQASWAALPAKVLLRSAGPVPAFGPQTPSRPPHLPPHVQQRVNAATPGCPHPACPRKVRPLAWLPRGTSEPLGRPADYRISVYLGGPQARPEGLRNDGVYGGPQGHSISWTCARAGS